MRRALGSILLFAFFAILLSSPSIPGMISSASNGGGTGTDGSLGTQVPLTTQFSSTLSGNYVAAGTGLRSTGSGTISVTIPTGASITKAFMIWGTMVYFSESTPSNIVLNGVVVTATSEENSGDLCAESNHYAVLFADVTGIAISGLNTVLLPNPGDLLEEGATLILVYSKTGDPNTQVMINVGAESFFGVKSSQSNFAFASSTGAAAKTTYIVADAQPAFGADDAYFNGAKIGSGVFTSADGQLWDTFTTDVTSDIGAGSTTANTQISSDGSDCIGYSAQVLSVAVTAASTTGAPEFPLGFLVLFALVVPILLAARLKFGDRLSQKPTP